MENLRTDDDDHVFVFNDRWGSLKGCTRPWPSFDKGFNT